MDILYEEYPEKNELWDFMLDVSSFPKNNFIRLKPGWFDCEDMNDAFLSNDDKEKARSTFESEKRDTVGLKLPLKLSNQDSDEDTYFHMFIQRAENIDGKSNELVIRNYLPISGVANFTGYNWRGIKFNGTNR